MPVLVETESKSQGGENQPADLWNPQRKEKVLKQKKTTTTQRLFMEKTVFEKDLRLK